MAIGGGSAIDTAKAVSVLLRYGGELCQYYGDDKVPGPVMPLVAVPTTAGSGSEVSPYSVVTDLAARAKVTIASAHLYPMLALLDFNLTISLPHDLTMFTGVDALAHAIEGFTSKKALPATDPIAVRSIRVIKAALPIACAHPENRDARRKMLHAASLSGVVLAHAHTTLAHKMGHMLTLEYGIPHGLAVGLLLPGVLAFNAAVIPKRVAEVARTLNPSPLREDPGTEAAYWLRCFLDRLGFPRKVPSPRVKASHAEKLARQVMAKPEKLADNPRAPSLNEIRRMYSVVL